MSEYIITDKQLKTATEAYLEHELSRPITDVFISGDKLHKIVRCKDCKHGHITIDGLYNKWCSLLATHDIDGDGFDPQNGYEPEPYFDSDFYCAWGERRDA